MSGGVVIGMFDNHSLHPHRQFNGYDVISQFTTNNFTDSHGSTRKTCIISEDILNELKTDYLDKLLGKNKNCQLSGRLGSFQKLLIIIQELNNLDTMNDDYNILLVEVMKLFTSLLNRAQSQHVEIVLLKKKLNNAENLINIKNEEIKNLKFELDKCTGNVSTGVGIGGKFTVTGVELPNQLLFLMNIDIVRAWYYHIFGVPDNCNILDPDKVGEIFSYLANNFSNLSEAKIELKKQIESEI